MLLLYQLDIGDLEDQDSLDDILDIARLEAAQVKVDRQWLSIAARNLPKPLLTKICNRLEISSREISHSRKSYGFGDGALLVGNMLGFLHSDQIVTILDCSTAQIKRVSASMARDTSNTIWRGLVDLDHAYLRGDVPHCLAILESLIGDTRNRESEVARIVREVIGPVTRFMEELVHLLENFPRPLTNFEPLQSVASNSELQLTSRAESLRKKSHMMDSKLLNLDLIAKSLAFFSHGSRCAYALQREGKKPLRDIVHKVLIWNCAYLLEVSKQISTQGYFDTALLLIFRSLELYALAFLWELKPSRLKLSESGQFSLDNKPNPRFVEVWDAFLEDAPTEYVNRVEREVDILRRRRNQNVLTHGFESIDQELVSQARTCVKGVLKHWDAQYHEGSGMKSGPVGDYVWGENSSGSLSMAIVQSILTRIVVSDV